MPLQMPCRQYCNLDTALCCNPIQPCGFLHPAALGSATAMEPTQPNATPGGRRRDTPLRRLIDDFLTSKETDSGAYAASAESELKRFADWMERRGADLDGLDDREKGVKLMRDYAKRLQRRVQGGGIAGSTANSYYAYISACLSYGVGDMVLSQNPALADAAQSELPADETSRSDQQFWSPEQRDQLVEHVTDRAREAIEERAFDAHVEARDRALATVLAYTGVRGAEILDAPKDDRDGRNGLRWGQVDLDRGTLHVRGKATTDEKQWQHASVPRPAREALAALERVQRPPTDAWPVFETSHAPSLYGAVPDDRDTDALVDEHGDIRAALRAEEIEPPSLSTEGARQLLQRLFQSRFGFSPSRDETVPVA
jgi:integrase